MIKRDMPRAFLDTNVIYPLVIRDILLWFAYEEMFVPFWSNDVLKEWILIMRRKALPNGHAKARVRMIKEAFPFAMVRGYRPLISDLHLPDRHDRHVLAAAIRIQADFIITQNLKDFPNGTLSPFGIVAMHADAFLAELITNNSSKAIRAFSQMVKQRKRPPQSAFEVLESLRKNGLKETAALLQKMLDHSA